eukprot:TRINITY_DN7949_c0_g1_i10.p1 TRINITY_DN7949_c0_g1~~TRINITY_DN7949_c0_g1_i10.p1  ORF type:complete len:265 (+),score=54.35 TRINITY_DN7949_c0_g1_i10:1096-1890(+)
MYLTDVLPKATYAAGKRLHRNTTTDGYLPKLNKPLESRLCLENQQCQNNIGNISIIKLHPSLKKIKESAILKRENSVEKLLAQSKAEVKKKKGLRNSKSVSPSRKVLHISEIMENVKESRDGIMNLIGYKYINKRPRLARDSIPGPINKSSIIKHSPYISDAYIKQIICRRNPIVKSINHMKLSVDDCPRKLRQFSLKPRRLPHLANHQLLHNDFLPLLHSEPAKPKDRNTKQLSPTRRKLVSVKSTKLCVCNVRDDVKSRDEC